MELKKQTTAITAVHGAVFSVCAVVKKVITSLILM